MNKEFDLGSSLKEYADKMSIEDLKTSITMEKYKENLSNEEIVSKVSGIIAEESSKHIYSFNTPPEIDRILHSYGDYICDCFRKKLLSFDELPFLGFNFDNGKDIVYIVFEDLGGLYRYRIDRNFRPPILKYLEVSLF